MTLKRRKHKLIPPVPPAQSKPTTIIDRERRERHASGIVTVTYETKRERDGRAPQNESPYTAPPAGPREYYVVRYTEVTDEGDNVRGGLYHERIASSAVVAKLVGELSSRPANTKITVYRVMETWERVALG
jgi:hypothetical protein